MCELGKIKNGAHLKSFLGNKDKAAIRLQRCLRGLKSREWKTSLTKYEIDFGIYEVWKYCRNAPLTRKIHTENVKTSIHIDLLCLQDWSVL